MFALSLARVGRARWHGARTGRPRDAESGRSARPKSSAGAMRRPNQISRSNEVTRRRAHRRQAKIGRATGGNGSLCSNCCEAGPKRDSASPRPHEIDRRQNAGQAVPATPRTSFAAQSRSHVKRRVFGKPALFLPMLTSRQHALLPVEISRTPAFSRCSLPRSSH